MQKKRNFIWADTAVRKGETRDIEIKISETFTGESIYLPFRVIRSKKEGPVVFVSAALHGDEVNGTGIIHALMYGEPLELLRGSLILLPVINVLGFEVSERYLPDRRDLNRSFPGDPRGTLASRIANTIFTEIVAKCDVGIDLHSAARHRTNYPNVRGDLSIGEVKRLAGAFGCELIVNSKGPEGSLRREACRSGCPTIILEAGEVFKMEPAVLDIGVRGVRNVLMHLGMLRGSPALPDFQERINRTQWVRSTMGGIIRFHIAPGDFVAADQPIASNYSVMGEHRDILRSPLDGIALGIATLPMVKPGEPVCNIAEIGKRSAFARRRQKGLRSDRLHRQASTDLATNITLVNSYVEEDNGGNVPED